MFGNGQIYWTGFGLFICYYDISSDFNIYIFGFSRVLYTNFSTVLRSFRMMWFRPCNEHWSQMSSKTFFHTFARRFVPDTRDDLFRNRTRSTLLDTDDWLGHVIVTTKVNCTYRRARYVRPSFVGLVIIQYTIIYLT